MSPHNRSSRCPIPSTSKPRIRPRVRVSLILLVFALVLGTLGVSGLPANAAAPTQFYVEQTGHSLGGSFLSWWIDNNGRETLGNPVTEPLSASGETTQYFEFGVLVEQQSGAIAREPAGSTLHTFDGSATASASPDESSIIITPIESIRTLSTLGGGYFYQVAPEIQGYYDSLGGREFFGRTLSPLESGTGDAVQWFEYGRIEHGPSGPRLGTVGEELAVARGVDMSTATRGDAPAFNPDRYTTFHGDGTIPNAEGVFIPSRIVIPSIDVDARIESIGITNGVMDTPKDEWNVGWYPSMASPGEWTNVVMAGHRDWWGVGPVVFWNLDKIRAGDKIYVIGPDGAGATYVVTLTWLIDAQAPADGLIADTGYEALTLITCAGQWTGAGYTDRQIIRAKRI